MYQLHSAIGQQGDLPTNESLDYIEDIYAVTSHLLRLVQTKMAALWQKGARTLEIDVL